MKNYLKQTLITLTCAALIASVSPNAARAHDVETHTQKPTEPSYQLLRLEQDRNEIHKGGPIAGVTISSLVVATGLGLIAGGAAAQHESNNPEPGCEEDVFSCDDWFPNFGKGMAISGGIMLAVGAVGLGVSAANLKQRNEKRRELDRRIRELQMQSYRVSVAHGAPQKAAMLRF